MIDTAPAGRRVEEAIDEIEGYLDEIKRILGKVRRLGEDLEQPKEEGEGDDGSAVQHGG